MAPKEIDDGVDDDDDDDNNDDWSDELDRVSPDRNDDDDEEDGTPVALRPDDDDQDEQETVDAIIAEDGSDGGAHMEDDRTKPEETREQDDDDKDDDSDDDDGFVDLAPEAEDAARSALAALAFNPNPDDDDIDIADPSFTSDTFFYAAGDPSNLEIKEWKVVTTDLYGGGGGTRFNDCARPNRRIANIAINAGALVDGISVLYSDGAATKHGGDGGGWHNYPLEDGEYVVGVDVRHGRFVQSLTLWTNLGRKLGPCGEGGFVLGMGRVRDVRARAPGGHALVGVHGRCGKYVDGIGFHWAPATISGE